jgi:muramoyltetrapeptide carboxypeptidase
MTPKSVPLDVHLSRAVGVVKPKALKRGSRIAVFAPASPGSEAKMTAGIRELRRLGFSVEPPALQQAEGYFAASTDARRAEFLRLLRNPEADALIGLRGGYGSNYLLSELMGEVSAEPKAVVGYSDLSSLQIFLWQRCRWVTFYGPMVAAGLDAGIGTANGYDETSLMNALCKTDGGWEIPLRGGALFEGDAEGRVVGGAMTLVEATIGTQWELDTRESILVLEDRAMKPYQVDRVLMHLLQARKLDGVKGIVLGDFPECEPPVAGSPAVRDVAERILKPLGIPVVFGAPIGHSLRSMLTIPLGVHARLHSEGEGTLEILEAAVTP